MTDGNGGPNSKRFMTYYADDFTGATDSLEALTSGGFNTVLFLDPPSSNMLSSTFPHAQCVGVAGMTRTMKSHEMVAELEDVLGKLSALESEFVHYKICSTFDSSPNIGSVGKAIEVGRKIFGGDVPTPLLVGTPLLKRYTVFGHHFADFQGETYRLDRHPIMSKHPVTPMDESDLRAHLQKQTLLQITLMDVRQLDLDITELYHRFVERTQQGVEVVLFDTVTLEHLQKIGALLDAQLKPSTPSPFFLVGSSAVQHALMTHLNTVKKKRPIYMEADWHNSDLVLGLSGSCSPMTQTQLDYAFHNGYGGIKVPLDLLTEKYNQAFKTVMDEVRRVIRGGEYPLVYTVGSTTDIKQSETLKGTALGFTLGRLFSDLIFETCESFGLRRVVIAGGDTSGYTMRALGVYALEMAYPLAKGAPLCKCYTNHPKLQGLEVALKGGQLGETDYFVKAQRLKLRG